MTFIEVVEMGALEAVALDIAGHAAKTCIDVHKEDLNTARKELCKAVDKGWERDYEAGGISTFVNSGKTVNA